MINQGKRRGGAGRGQGRKPLTEGEASVVVPVRMTVEQRRVFREKGGAVWLRSQLASSLRNDPDEVLSW